MKDWLSDHRKTLVWAGVAVALVAVPLVLAGPAYTGALSPVTVFCLYKAWSTYGDY